MRKICPYHKLPSRDPKLLVCDRDQCGAFLVDPSEVPIHLTNSDIKAICKTLFKKYIFWATVAVIILTECFQAWRLHEAGKKLAQRFQRSNDVWLVETYRDVTGRIAMQFEQPRISNLVSEVAVFHGTNLLNQQIQPAISKLQTDMRRSFDEFTSLSKTNIALLVAATDIATLIVRAQNDDARALDTLVEMSQTNGLALRASEQISWELERDRLLEGKAGLGSGGDPWEGTTFKMETATKEDYVVRYHQVNIGLRMNLVSEFHSQARFTSEEKLNFLVRVIETEVSAKCRANACALLDILTFV